MIHVITEWLNSHPIYCAEEIIKKIRSYEYISFDIFDTLIKRTVEKPTDVFIQAARQLITELDIGLRPEALANARIDAEIHARKLIGNGREVTLDEIYRCIAPKYRDIAEKMKCFELNVERQTCHENPVMKQVYDWCRENGKKIVIISDMYLNKAFLVQLLRECGYEDFQELFVSSDLRETKSTGVLYKKVCRELGIPCKKIIHIGDSVRADYLAAKRNHLAAVHIARNPDRTIFLKTSKLPVRYRGDWKRMAHILSSYIRTEWNAYYQYGFEIIGPLLFWFCTWLQDKTKELQTDRLFFLARDGFLIQQAYEHLFGSKGCPYSYLYLSRKAVVKAQIWARSELQDIMDLFPASRYLKCQDFCAYLDVDFKSALPLWISCGLTSEDYFLPKEFLSDRRLKTFYELIRQEMIDKSKETYKKLFRYFEQNKFCGNCVIVDIGWKGTIQDCLKVILDAEPSYGVHLSGCYLGMSLEARDMKDKYSFIPIEENPQEFVSAFLEYPFLAPEGSLNGYSIYEDGMVKPELAPYEFNTSEAAIVKQMQAGTLFFIDCVKNTGWTDAIKDQKFAYAALKRISRQPTFQETKIFGNLTLYESGKATYMAAPHNLIYYCLHLNRLKYDLSVSGWRVGFLKRLLRLPLDYNKPLHWYKEKNLKMKSE